MASMTEVLKGTSFKWTPKPESSLEEVKNNLNQAPVLALSFFDKLIKVECDASGVGIGGFLTQEGKPLVLFLIRNCVT